MLLYTIGFTKKTASHFFEGIKYRMIQMLVDVRLKNTSQLMRFSHGQDIEYFLQNLCNCQYEHCVNYAPTKEILTDWKKKRITWPEYVQRYTALMTERNSVHDFLTRYYGLYESVCLLCSEPTPEHCHRRLFAEMIHEQRPDVEIVHI